MDIIEESTDDGIVERHFALTVAAEVVPGIWWLPQGASSPRPTVLIGHGGTQHKRAPSVLGLARKLVSERGYGVIALDAPGHGDRMTPQERQASAELLARREGGRLVPMPDDLARRLAAGAPRAAAEWKALLDDLVADPQRASGPFGYYGVSMGTGFGMPMLASEPRITAAVLGLGGLRDGNRAQRSDAARITIPLLFLFQWDDDFIAREAGLALWDAFGSKEKTMHINPGPHIGIPPFERDAAAAFYRRHLEG